MRIAAFGIRTSKQNMHDAQKLRLVSLAMFELLSLTKKHTLVITTLNQLIVKVV